MKKYRKLGVEDWMIVIAVVILLLIAGYFLTGCASQQNVSKIKYSSGCLIEVEAASSEVATHIVNTVDFVDCGTTGKMKYDENQQE